MRHEGTSRLFEADFTIEQVALVTGHKDWKMLRRYTHLRPEMLHTIPTSRVAMTQVIRSPLEDAIENVIQWIFALGR
nr:hypothetical protein [Mesorhizobium sp. CA8]